MVKFLLILLLAAFLCGIARSAFVQFGPSKDREGNMKMYYYEANSNAQGPWVPKSSCADPLSIDSVDEEVFLFSRVYSSDTFAVGRQIYTGGVRVNGQWVWQKSGAPINYGMTWGTGEPNNSGGQENCLTIKKNGNTFQDISLNDFNCNYANVGFICQQRNWVPSELTKLGEYNYRDDSLAKNVKMTYYLFTGPGKNANDATSYSYYALGYGWNLAKIATKGEQDYLLNLVKNRADIGVNWLILVGPTKREGVWYDTSLGPSKPITYAIDWHSGEPNNVGGIENCMGILKTSGKTAMMDVECSIERNSVHSFIITHIDYS